MTSSEDNCSTLREYLTNSVDGDGGQAMLHNKLQTYFHWKSVMGKMHHGLKKGWFRAPAAPKTGDILPTAQGFESAAMKRKRERAAAPSHKRRRVRGGGAVGASGGPRSSQGEQTFAANATADAEALGAEATDISNMYVSDFRSMG